MKKLLSIFILTNFLSSCTVILAPERPDPDIVIVKQDHPRSSRPRRKRRRNSPESVREHEGEYLWENVRPQRP